MRHIGFTGTRHGMTEQQMSVVNYVISRIVASCASNVPFVVHHGDCVGADSQFHHLCEQRGFEIVGHPPENGMYRAHCRGFRTQYRPTSYYRRNKAIVSESDVMIATPKDPTEQTRGGTWQTVRFARKSGRPLAIVWPDGRITYERWRDA